MELVINNFVIIPNLRGRAGGLFQKKKKKKIGMAVHTRENENRSVIN